MVVSGLRKFLTISVPAVFVAVLLVACAIELWVRAAWDERKGRPGFFLSDAIRGQRLAAGYDGWFAGVPVHINSLELRDPREYALEKLPNTFRILVLGDSVTFGHGSLYAHTYPYLLEQRLKAWRPDVDWQVWNAAVPGYNTSQELAQLVEVGDRFKPDLVVVGFFWNDLIGNQPVRPASRLWSAAVYASSFARRFLYSFEFYKRVYLTARWRLSGAKEDRLRAEHAEGDEALLAVNDAGALPQQKLTPFDRLTDDEVRHITCVYGMKPNPATVPAMQRDAGYPRWIEAVRGFQRLQREGRYRIVFFVNDTPPVCPDGDVFYDGGSKAIDDLYLRVLGEETPAATSYDAFLHVRPSQMPNATGHSIGNSNVVKADALFDFLRDRVLPHLTRAASGV
ncbi:MAG: hypothetical protein AUF76_14465 [Acidobacteria bacterium 13_1_20CM_2_65_9]|nr:MAG: hypothetical protein AUF76_14465 [Acidobacteria bacterium 13_1_20CM_2_65_9]